MIRLLSVVAVCAAAVVACGKASSHDARQQAVQSRQTGTISKVVDGDTIKVDTATGIKTVRLIGIDTPETHKPGVKVECGGPEASANMASLAPIGAKATLVQDPTQDSTDRYGRLLAYVSVNHRSLQLGQLYAGWAEVYVYGNKPFQRVDAYRRASSVAKRAGRGVWGKCNGDFHSNQPAN